MRAEAAAGPGRSRGEAWETLPTLHSGATDEPSQLPWLLSHWWDMEPQVPRGQAPEQRSWGSRCPTRGEKGLLQPGLQEQRPWGSLCPTRGEKVLLQPGLQEQLPCLHCSCTQNGEIEQVMGTI